MVSEGFQKGGGRGGGERLRGDCMGKVGVEMGGG